MPANELNCPKCGGVIKINPDDDLTTHCPYCDSLIEIPEKYRQQPVQNFDVLIGQLGQLEEARPKESYRTTTILVIAVIVFVLGMMGFGLFIALKNSAPGTVDTVVVNASETPTETPLPSPTPAFAYPIQTFGGSGSGEGLFNNPRYIDADGQGNVYVGDYDNGRIQRFNTDGVYQNGWSVSDSGEHIYGMAVTYDGIVFVSVGNNLNKYDGQSGQLLASIEAYGGGEYADLATTIDGNLLAVWFEGRWGMYSGGDPGHREDLVEFDPDLTIIKKFQAPISSILDDALTDAWITVGGDGTIYAVYRGTVFVFDKDGIFKDQFTPSSGAPGSFSWVNDIAVDGQGRIYIAESYTIHVFDSNFAFVDDIPMEINASSIAIDANNNIWVLSSDKVQELVLRP